MFIVLTLLVSLDLYWLCSSQRALLVDGRVRSRSVAFGRVLSGCIECSGLSRLVRLV